MLAGISSVDTSIAATGRFIPADVSAEPTLVISPSILFKTSVVVLAVLSAAGGGVRLYDGPAMSASLTTPPLGIALG